MKKACYIHKSGFEHVIALVREFPGIPSAKLSEFIFKLSAVNKQLCSYNIKEAINANDLRKMGVIKDDVRVLAAHIGVKEVRFTSYPKLPAVHLLLPSGASNTVERELFSVKF